VVAQTGLAEGGGRQLSAAIFFDLDGTLTDPKIGITRCIQYALEKMGEPVPTIEELTWCIGPPLLSNFEQLAGAAKAEEGVRLYRERFADIGLFENDPYPEIHDTLATLQARGAKLYVASSKPLVFVDRILARYELSEFFINTYGSELDGTRTDKSELLAYALTDSNVRQDQATMIGDRKHDAIGAANNDMDFIGVLYGYGDRQELESVGATVLVEAHHHLLDKL
jgi:phosphoglycolate phosphatase